MSRLDGIPTFDFDLTRSDPIPENGIARATELMRAGRLFRYGEVLGSGSDDVSRFEQDFAKLIGRKYGIAVNSCGSAMFLALRCSGLNKGDRVLCNSFTLAPVPGAVHHAGGVPILVEVDENLMVDLDDLRDKAYQYGAHFLLLSHMRGHLSDLESVEQLCHKLDITLIEDCAHTLGASWGDRPSGSFGKASCFSFQSFKHVNSGEGGMIVTDDDEIAAKAILYSGSYMLYPQHLARPRDAVFEPFRGLIPNYSLRMNSLAAVMAQPQLELLPERRAKMNGNYRLLESLLTSIEEVTVTQRPKQENFVGSSFQFRLPGFSMAEIGEVVQICDDMNLHLNWFGRERMQGFTSRPDQWEYIEGTESVPRTRSLLSSLIDMRIPPSMSAKHCRLAATIITASINAVSSSKE